MKITSLSLLLLLFCSVLHAEDGITTYSKSLKGINDSWHRVVVDEHILEFAREDLSDIRIMSVNNGDTVYAPHIIQLKRSSSAIQERPFEIINQAKTDSGLYITLKFPEDTVINRLILDLKESNYEHILRIEGSQDQKEWFLIKKDCRILSIKNAHTDYTYNRIHFSNSSYRFVRLFIAGENPSFMSAGASYSKEVAGNENEYTHSPQVSSIDDDNNNVIDIQLKRYLPISRLELDVNAEIDYYRSLLIEYISDSSQTEKGMVYHYRRLYSGTLSSLEDHSFSFNQKRVKKIRIKVFNNDNQPLEIKVGSVYGFADELIVRIDNPADWFIHYGNQSLGRANYDLEYFRKNIPEQMSVLDFGDVNVHAIIVEESSPLIEDDIWLWLVLGIGVLLMGAFTLKMIRSREAEA